MVCMLKYLWPPTIVRALEAYAVEAHRNAEEAIEDFARQMEN